MIVTLTQALDAEVQLCKKVFSRSVRPIYSAASEKHKPIALGSCVLITVGGRCFGVTAAHVIDELDTVSLHLAGTKGYRTVAIEGLITSAESEHLDFAFWEIDDVRLQQLGDVAPIADIDTLAPATITADRLAVAMGYRASKNKKGINHVEKTIATSLTSYTAIAESSPKELESLGYNDIENVFIQYGKYATGGDGRKVNNPPPIGLSGGAVVDFGAASSPLPYTGAHQAALAGIFTEYHKSLKVCVGVRIHVVLSAIMQKMGRG